MCLDESNIKGEESLTILLLSLIMMDYVLMNVMVLKSALAVGDEDSIGCLKQREKKGGKEQGVVQQLQSMNMHPNFKTKLCKTCN